MSEIRKQIVNVFFSPIPGLGWIPGVGHITGEHKLKKLQKEARKALHNHKIQEELKNIDIDLSLMQSADVRDQNDRDIQAKLFGKPLFNKEKDAFEELPIPTELQPMMAQFIELENFKRTIRNQLRPDMERQIEAILKVVKESPNVLTPALETMFQELQRSRLTMVTTRTNMMSKRQEAYGIVEAYLRGQNTIPSPAEGDGKISIPTEIVTENKRVPLAILHDIELSKMPEREIDARIDEQLHNLLVLHEEGDKLQKKIDAELNGQRRKMRRRAGICAALVATTALAAFGGREGAALYRHYRPYGEHTEEYGHVDINPNEQEFSVFKRAYKNRLSDDGRLDVKLHAVETGVEPWHGIVTARTMDIAYKAATGDPAATADLGRVMLDEEQDSLGSNNTSIPFWKRSLFVPRRLNDTERMMTTTTEHHVFNQSIVSNRQYAPGTSDAKKERKFLLSATCPITIPCGNDTSRSASKGIQYASELAHYPRYAVQIGEGAASQAIPGAKDAFFPMGGHPFVFATFPMPKTNGRLDKDVQRGERYEASSGSSFCSSGFGGNIGGQKSLFPQLNWDNIYYATALASRSTVVKFQMVNPQKTPHTGLQFTERTGFGLIDPETVELVLHNMLYQRTLHPEINHNPQVIVRDATETGEARREHKIVLPANKDVFKLVLDIIPPPYAFDELKDKSGRVQLDARGENATNAYAILKDEYGNTKRINFVKGSDITRFTDWSHMGTPGSTITITSPVPIRVGYAAHINDRGAIGLGLTQLDKLKSIEEIKRLIDPEKLKALPISMPVAPTIVREEGQKLSLLKDDVLRKGVSWHDDRGRTYAEKTHKRWQEQDARGDQRKV
jgi:hypothetical protein